MALIRNKGDLEPVFLIGNNNDSDIWDLTESSFAIISAKPAMVGKLRKVARGMF